MAKQPKSYTADHPVYVNGKYHLAGEVFVTDADKEDTWDHVDKGEKAAIEASDPIQHDDPNIEALGIAELRTLAVTKKVAFEGLSKKELVTAIKAADEPRL